MEIERYRNLIIELRKLIKAPKDKLPRWGKKQSSDDDKAFYPYSQKYDTWENAKKKIDTLENKDYNIRRWFNAKIAEIYEFLFAFIGNGKVVPNSNKKSKEYDFKVNNVPFDLKNSNVSNKFGSVDYALTEPKKFIEWQYNNQSGKKAKNGRYGTQNRLFYVVESKDENETREYITLHYWEQQKKVIRDFIDNFDIDNSIHCEIDGKIITAQVIFFVKNKNSNSFTVKINNKREYLI